jgi:hypothetical protein
MGFVLVQMAQDFSQNEFRRIPTKDFDGCKRSGNPGMGKVSR